MIFYRLSYKWSVALMVVFVTMACKEESPIVGDVMLVGGIIVDGTGNDSYKADVMIRNDLIYWIGDADLIDYKVDTIIDADEKVIAPGFIDIHAHGNPLTTPEFINFLSQGVTSIALGMDGASQEVGQLSSWFQKVDSIGTGVHVLPFIGHGTLRTESGIGRSLNPSEEELEQMDSLCDMALNMGCWGLSLGLEYHPGYYASVYELTRLARVVGGHDGLITSHIRNEDNDQIRSSLMEMIHLTRYARVNISHLKVVYGKGSERAEEILSLMRDSIETTGRLTSDIYPYNASYTGIRIVFPDWAKDPDTYPSIVEDRRTELAEYLRQKVTARNGPGATLFGTDPYRGKTLADLEEEYNLPFEEVLMDKMGPDGASAAYFVMDSELQERLVLDPTIMFSSDGSPTMHHPRGYGSNAKVIEKYVVRDSLMRIEEAVRKMTSLPARTLGLPGRGLIRKGYYADLVIFSPSNIHAKATYDNPHELAEGVDMVFVDGVLAYNGEKVLCRKGRILLKQR